MKTSVRKTSVKKTSTRKTTGAVKGASSRTKLRDIMTPNVVVIAPEDSLQMAARKMQERDIGFLPVCDGMRLIGTLSDRDITVRAVAAGRDPKSTQVREFATPRKIWCFDDQDIDEAARVMQNEQVRRLMVLNRDEKRLVGVVSLGDLAANGTKEISSDVLESTSPAAD
ncbi:MAG TPA: CBS domain-containing protein [Anaerolineales bacterium]